MNQLEIASVDSLIDFVSNSPFWGIKRFVYLKTGFPREEKAWDEIISHPGVVPKPYVDPRNSARIILFSYQVLTCLWMGPFHALSVHLLSLRNHLCRARTLSAGTRKSTWLRKLGLSPGSVTACVTSEFWGLLHLMGWWHPPCKGAMKRKRRLTRLAHRRYSINGHFYFLVVFYWLPNEV